MSSMPAARVEDHPLADESNRLVLGLATIPVHHGQTRGPRRAERNPEQRFHLELLHFLLGEDFNTHAQCFKLFRAGGEFHRTEHIGRLVDQIARKLDAFGNHLPNCEGLLATSRIVVLENHADLAGFLVVVLGFHGLVGVEGIGPHQQPQRHIGGGLGGRGCLVTQKHRHLPDFADLRENLATNAHPFVTGKLVRISCSDQRDPVSGCVDRRDNVDGRE